MLPPMTQATASTLYTLSDQAKTYELVGNFPGDEKILQEIEWCRETFVTQQPMMADKQNLDRMVSLLDVLPMKSRYAVATQVLSLSPLVDTILKHLFAYCFIQENKQEEEKNKDDSLDGADDFVLIWTNSNRLYDSHKYHIMPVVLTLLNFSEPSVGANLCRQYLQCGSSRYSGPFLRWSAKQPPQVFANDELWQAYCSSPALVQKQIIVACMDSTAHESLPLEDGGNPPHPRQDFFKQVLKSGDDAAQYPKLIFYCSSAHLEKCLDKTVPLLGMRRWPVHAKTYLKYMKEKLLAESSVLNRGGIWKIKFEPALPDLSLVDLKPQHIHELSQLLLDCRVYEIFNSNTPYNVQSYLQELARNGQDITNFEVVQPVELSHSLRSVIPKKERVKIAITAIESNDWRTFERYQSVVSFQHLPFKETFVKASPNDLWKVLSGKTDKDNDTFLQYFAKTDFTQNNRRHFTIDALLGWARWHLRSTPLHLTREQQELYCYNTVDMDENQIMKSLWRRWYLSLQQRYFENGLFDLTKQRVLKARNTSRPKNQSKITLEARYAHKLLEIAVQGIQAIPSNYCDETVVLAHLRASLDLFGDLQYNNLKVVRDFNMRMEEDMMNEFLPRLSGVLSFNPTDCDHYVNQTTLVKFFKQAKWLGDSVGSHPDCRRVLRSFLKNTLEKILSEASADGHHVAHSNALSRFTQLVDTKTSKVKIFFYDSSLHHSATCLVSSILSTLLLTTKHVDGVKEEQTLAWNLLVGSTFADDKELEKPMFLGVYLGCVDDLPAWLFELKKTEILDWVVASIAKEQQKKANSCRVSGNNSRMLHKLGLLTDVLARSDLFPDEGEKNEILVGTGKFKYDIVQETFKKKTTGINGDQRAEGHIQWLQSAFDDGSLPTIANAITYTVNRIRNEAGVYRRNIYTHIQSNLQQVVIKSLKEPTDENFAAAGKVSGKLVEMIQSDLSRRDSVSNHSLSSVPFDTIMQVADQVNCNPATPRQKIRQLWISFAIRIHWLSTKAIGGEQGLTEYTWPSRHGKGIKLHTCSWISSKAFDEAYPRLRSHNKVAKLQERVNIVEILKDDLGVKYLGPAEFVDSLSEALEDVWKTKFPDSWALSWEPDAWVSDNGNTSKALLQRLISLFKICGITWEEVPLLVATFDRTFADLEAAPEYHFKFASELLVEVVNLYACEPYHGDSDHGLGLDLDGVKRSHFYQVRLVSSAIEKIFRYAVAKSMDFYIRPWYNFWSIQVLQQGRHNWEAIPTTNKRLLPFLAKYSSGCEPPMCSLLVDKFDNRNRKTVLARELLAMSPSALQKTQVREVLKVERQDWFWKMLQDEDFLKGPFAPQFNDRVVGTEAEDKADREKFVYEWLEPSTLGSFAPALSSRYADYALKMASNPDYSVADRVAAIENFCGSPSTSHQEVLRALQQLDLDDVICEAIIVKVFSLDSPWHVVSFLLNSSLANPQQQRMTATLLGHIAKNVQIAKVIMLLGMLLEETRRRRLGMQLHKSIIRMLFDNRTPEATNLLQTEWDRDVATEIRYILVEKCLETVVRNNKGSVEWEWGILESFVNNADGASNELLVNLFSPTWQGCPALSHVFLYVPRNTTVAKKDKVLKFLENKALGQLTITDSTTCQKYCELLKPLEGTVSNPTWKMLAKAYRLSFTVNRSDNFLDQSAVDEMKEFLMLPPSETDMDKFGLQAVASLFGRNCATSLKLKRCHGVSLEVLCDENETAQKFRQCVGHLLSRIIDTPMRQQSLRRMTQLILLRMLEEFRTSTSPSSLEFWNALIESKFHDELSLLSADASSVLQSFGGGGGGLGNIVEEEDSGDY